MVLIDTHVHLNFPDFREDMEAVISRAKDFGVIKMINVGTDLQTSRESIRLAERFGFIYATAGIHPHFADKFSEFADELGVLAKNPQVVAVGEIGLDYFRNLSTHQAQIEAFKSQLDLALSLSKPIVLHCRDAYTEMLGMLEEYYIPRLPDGQIPGVIHSFAAGSSHLQKFLKQGFYVGINNLVTYPKNLSLQDAVKILPLDRIVLETDCPYLPPQHLKGERCEPIYVADVARKVAELKGMSVKQVEDASADNARTIFKI
ncbi:hypothetical protein DRH29_01225 [candidate division Kazan bacterium]|uniref:Hydrolase TatD n=1 Tax=candidate division Kazan bacterium TaxID=2202143 RepID=A0A420ZDK4_UNCK3|nr:MAG: hypothetical protein DRH29_01225 [candidate division Kazan bacterium]